MDDLAGGVALLGKVQELQFGHGLVPWMTEVQVMISGGAAGTLQFGHGLVPWMTAT